MIKNELLYTIEKLRRLKRQHASFYEWSEKQTKESGIVDEFLDPNNHICIAHQLSSGVSLNQIKTPLHIREIIWKLIKFNGEMIVLKKIPIF